MGLPPASPRFKFVHTHPGGSGNPTVPRRPPRQQPPSPSVRSRSLELLDQDDEEERKLVSVVVVQARPPLPRPRSRSLDGLLDEDAKNSGESCDQDKQKSRNHLAQNCEEEKIVFASEAAESQNSKCIKAIASENNPVPLPRIKLKTATECKSEAENACISLGGKDDSEKETPPMRPPKPIRRSSSEGQSSTTSGKYYADQEQQLIEEQRTRKIMQGERLTAGNNENEDDDNDDHNRLMLKTRSCGAGLDSDGSVSSSEYGDRPRGPKQGPGSLLSLPAGAEPKRKRNFMDKCVNKVRSFMRK